MGFFCEGNFHVLSAICKSFMWKIRNWIGSCSLTLWERLGWSMLPSSHWQSRISQKLSTKPSCRVAWQLWMSHSQHKLISQIMFMAIEGVVNWVHAICEYFTAKTYYSNLWKFSPQKETCYTVSSNTPRMMLDLRRLRRLWLSRWDKLRIHKLYSLVATYPPTMNIVASVTTYVFM